MIKIKWRIEQKTFSFHDWTHLFARTIYKPESLILLKSKPKCTKLKFSTLQYWPSWCWRCVGCRPPRCICCKLGPETWRRARGSSHDWLLRGVGFIFYHQIRHVFSLNLLLCSPKVVREAMQDTCFSSGQAAMWRSGSSFRSGQSSHT